MGLVITMPLDGENRLVLEELSYQQHTQNIEKWGKQERGLLLLCMLEELGELTQAYLEANAEETDPIEQKKELIDLMALQYAYYDQLVQNDIINKDNATNS